MTIRHFTAKDLTQCTSTSDCQIFLGDVLDQSRATRRLPALVAQRNAHLRQRVLGLARALRRLGGPAGEALQRQSRVCCSTPEPSRRSAAPAAPRRRPRSCRRSCRSHSPPKWIDRPERRDRRPWRRLRARLRGTDAGAQQLRLTAEALQPARGTLARALDALQALLAALADRDQLGLDLTAALDRQPNRVGMGASSHGSACELGFGSCEGRSLGDG